MTMTEAEWADLEMMHRISVCNDNASKLLKALQGVEGVTVGIDKAFEVERFHVTVRSNRYCRDELLALIERLFPKLQWPGGKRPEGGTSRPGWLQLYGPDALTGDEPSVEDMPF